MSAIFKVNVSAIITKNDKVLIQKRALDEEVFPGFFGIPGGTVELGDPDLISALEREVYEETNVEIEKVTFFKNNIVNKVDKGTLYIVFLAKYKSGVAKPMDGTEQVDWYSKEEFKEMKFTPNTKDLLLEYYEHDSFRRN